MKKCCKCKFEKSFEEFSKNKTRKDGYQTKCKSCVKKYQKENKDKKSEYDKQYYKENKDKKCEQNKQYREGNKDKISEYNKQYNKENKDKMNALWSKRRAKKLQATPSWLTVEHLKSIERFYTISKEMGLISGVKYHVDHIIPLQGETVCGLHVPWNLQVIEASENLSKQNKLLDQDQEFYHQILEFDDLMENIL
jgi:antitoxin component HigA of HigAB toxin-antitoxin module